MDPLAEFARMETRRYFFGRAAAGIGTAALATLLSPGLARTEDAAAGGGKSFGELPALHFAPKAKRVIWLFMANAPRSWTCSITSPRCRRCSTRTCPIRFAAASESPR